MRSTKGFTLIEVLTAGLISTIVAGALLSILYLTNNNIRDGALHLQVGQMQTIASDQLRTSAHSASGVKAELEPLPEPFTDPKYAAARLSQKEIIFCNPAGDRISAYRINTVSNYLEEWIVPPGGGIGGYQPFQVGTDIVYLDGAISEFDLLPGRIAFKVRLAIQDPTRIYTFPMVEEAILCRNPHP